LNISELIRSSLRALIAHKLRSFLTLLGIVISVSSIVAVVSIISGLKQMIRDQVMILSPDMFIVARFAGPMSTQEWLNARNRPNITVNDYVRLRDAGLPSVAAVGADAVTRRVASYGANKLERTSIIGATANCVNILNINVDDSLGRWFTAQEELATKYVAVIGASVKEEFFGLQDPIGRTILVAGLPFQVVGVMKKEGKTIFGDSGRDSTIYIPFSVFRRNFLQPWWSIDINIKAKSLELVEEAKDEVRAYLRAMRHTPFRDPDPFGLTSQDMILDFINKITAAIFSFIILITGVSLFVGATVIMNIMLVSVAERTQEIGIRRAIGAKKRDIMRQFLLEAILLSLVGGIFGFLLGAGLALSVKGMTGFPAQVTFSIVAMAIGLAVASGLIAGLLPARRAANLLGIDALRAE
jgi:putative ABC transport system permease protein